jgi:hypothetical protein
MAISVSTQGKDFDSIVDSLIDFATIQYGDQASANRVWSDFNISSFSRNWAELVAYVGDQLMFYMDTQANQSYLRSATIPSFIIDIANQLGYEVPTQQASSGKVQLTFIGPAQVGQFYPVFAGNIQFITTRAVIATQAGSLEVDAIQGAIFNESFTADGIQNEPFTLLETDIIVDTTNPNPELRSPIVTVNGTTYNVVTTLIDSAPNSTDVIRKELPDGRTKLIFGDGILGRRIVENESVNIVYRTQGGTQGNIEAGEIAALGAVIQNLASVTNATPFSGGVDRLTLQQIKDRVPLSLKTVAGAVSLPDFSDILIAHFPQVLTAKAALNFIQSGIDIDIFVLPNSESVTNITDNRVLFNTLTDFIERRKVVGTQFLIKDANPIDMSVSIEAYLNSDASRSSVEADIREQVTALFDLQTGGGDGSGVGFQELVRISDLFDVLRGISGLSRFEIKKHTIIPRVDEQVASPNQNFFVSKVDVYGESGDNEWLVATSEIANPEPDNGQVSYKVFKRTLGNTTSISQDSITDSNLDLTVLTGEALVINNTTIKDSNNVFTVGQFNDYIVVDSNNNIWRIDSTLSRSLILASPALNDAAITSVPNGDYKIVQSFSGKVIGVSGASFSILYNTHNQFFSQGASFDLITTLKSQFILSEEQSNTGTYGVPASIASVTPVGPNPGDLVGVSFNSNPNLSVVDTSFTLVDSIGEVFEIESVTDNDSPLASYNNPALVDSTIKLTGSGSDRALSIKFIPNREVNNAFLEVTLSIEKDSSPLGAIFVEIRQDDGAGNPGSLVQFSNAVSTSSISAGIATISFNFPADISLVEGDSYHLVVQSDATYKTSYINLQGHIAVGVDTSTLQYSPAKTAEGSIRLNSTALDVRSTSTGSITVTDNFIRSTKQATLLVKLLDNASFSTGTNSITIAGQPFLAVVGAPGPGEFEIGATLTATRDNLHAALNLALTGIAASATVSTDSLKLTADVTNYKGEAGNSITVSVIDQGTQNFDVGGLPTLVGGIDGDKIEVIAPQLLNSGLVAYTYTSSTGIVQFASAISIPAFQAGDLFRDGAKAEHAIISVNDGLNQITLATGLTVDNSVSNSLSGSVIRTFTYTFGDNVSVGATATLTASNLATAIDTQPYLSASGSLEVVNLSAGLDGEDGNIIKMSKNDAGQDNFTLSGETLTGGLNSDILAINSVEFTPVIGAPSLDGEFELDLGSLSNTLANLEDRINNHPSLVGVVTAALDVGARSVQIAASGSGSAGNDITLQVVNDSSGEITVSAPTLLGGEDNLSVKSNNGLVWTTVVPDSDMIFFIGVNSDNLVVVSKADANGNQLLPQLSLNGNFDAGLGKRYYSDDSEVSFIVATRSPNSFILGGENVDIFGKGINAGSSIRVDQFMFRTSKREDDVTNLRESEIPVLKDENLKTNLLGGVN